jgi:alpha-tubulin suppressor-like RCC1 family protein
MYDIHFNCNVGVFDDSGGSVYITAFKQNYGNVDSMSHEARNGITEFFKSNHATANPGIIRLDFPASSIKSPVDVSGSVFHVFSNVNTTQFENITIETDYSVYAIAKDIYENYSTLLDGGRGQIPPQRAPVLSSAGNVMNALRTIDLYGNIDTTVPYVYNTVVCTNQNHISNIISFFESELSSHLPDTNVDIENVSLNVSFTQPYNSIIGSNTDYDPFVDGTINHYAYVYAKSDLPHNQTIVYEYPVYPTHTPRSGISLETDSFKHTKLRDLSANVAFTVGNVDTEYYMMAYASQIATPELDGKLKKHLIDYGVHGNVDTIEELIVNGVIDVFFSNTDDLSPEQDMTNAGTYYIYVLVRDKITGQYTRIPQELSVTTGCAPEVLRVYDKQFNRVTDSIRFSMDIEEEQNGGNVRAIALVDDNTIDYDTLFTYANIAFQTENNLNTYLSDEIQTPMTAELTTAFDRSNSTYVKIQKNTNYYIHLLLDDILGNKRTYTSDQLVIFEPSFEAKPIQVYKVEGAGQQFFNFYAIDNDPNTLATINQQTVSADFIFEGGHKIILSKVLLDISNIECTNIESIVVRGLDGKNGNNDLSLTPNGQFVNGRSEFVMTIPYDNVNNDSAIAYPEFKITITSSDANKLTIGSLRFEGTVYDDKSPVLGNIEFDTITHNINFELTDYSNVDVQIFHSQYLWANVDEQNAMFDTITSQQFTGPMYEATYSVYVNAFNVIDDPSNPSNSQKLNPSENLSGYVTYIRAIDSSPLRNTTILIENRSASSNNGSGVPSGPVIHIKSILTRYDPITKKTEMNIQANVTDNFLPFKYKVEVYPLGASRETDNVDNWSSYYPPSTTPIQIVMDDVNTKDDGYMILEGGDYDVRIHAINSIGQMANVTQTVVFVPLVPELNVTRVAYVPNNNTLDVEISFFDNLSDANIYAALFTTPDMSPSEANLFFDTYKDTDTTLIQRLTNVNTTPSHTFNLSKVYTDHLTGLSSTSTLSGTDVYYIYVYAIENRSNGALHTIHTTTYGTAGGAFALTRMTGDLNADAVGNIAENINTLQGEVRESDSVHSLTNQFNNGTGTSTTLTPYLNDSVTVKRFHEHLGLHLNGTNSLQISGFTPLSTYNYLLVSMWVYPLDKNTDPSDSVLISTSAFNLSSQLIYTDTVSNANIDFGTLSEGLSIEPNMWNNITLEISAGSVIVYANDKRLENSSISTSIVSVDTIYIGSKTGTSQFANIGVDGVYVNTVQTNGNRQSALDVSDKFAPSVKDVSAIINMEGNIAFSANIMDQYPSNVSFAAFSNYYGMSEPYVGLEGSLVDFFERNKEILPTENTLVGNMKTIHLQAKSNRVFANIYSDVSSMIDSSTGSYHVYMYVQDENGFSRIVYTNQIFGNDITTNAPRFTAFVAENSDSAAKNISVSLKNKSPIQTFATGKNNHWQLAIDNDNVGKQTPTETMIGYNIIKVASSQLHTLFLTLEGNVYGVGTNRVGQLGNNLGFSPNLFQTTPLQVIADHFIIDVFCNDNTSVFITDNFEVYYCGRNPQNPYNYQYKTVKINIPGNEKIEKIAIGNLHFIFLTDTGVVYAWGENTHGNLGIGSKTSPAQPVLSFINEIEDVKATGGVSKIACTAESTFFLTKDGKLYATGQNDAGHLGQGDKISRSTPVRVLGLLADKFIIDVQSGLYHVLVLTDDNKVYGFGSNSNGALGLPSRGHILLPEEFYFVGKPIVSITCGRWHSFITTEDFEIHAFGDDGLGQLGNGSKGSGNTVRHPIVIPGIQIGFIFAGLHSESTFFVTANTFDGAYATIAYPSTFTPVSEDAVLFHLNTLIEEQVLTTTNIDHVTTMTVYFENIAADVSSTMEFNTAYNVYAVAINTQTNERTLVVTPVSILTSVAPQITDFQARTVDIHNIRVTASIVEESEDLTVYAAVFDKTYSEALIINFLTDSEFMDEHLAKYKKSYTTERGLDMTFDTYHTDIMFHTETEPLMANADYQIAIYVIDNNHRDVNTVYIINPFTIEPNVTYDDRMIPTIDSFVLNPLDLSASIDLTVSDIQSNVDIRVVIFASNISDNDAITFLNHANLEGYGYTMNDVSQPFDQASFNLNKAVDLTHVGTRFDVNMTASTIHISGEAIPQMTLFTDQVYIFNVTDGTPFYLSDSSGTTSPSAQLGLSYISRRNVEYPTIAELLSENDDLAYVRYEAPSNPINLTYRLHKKTITGGTINVIHSNSVQLIQTDDNTHTYHVYAYARDSSRRKNSVISSKSFKVGNPPTITYFTAMMVT